VFPARSSSIPPQWQCSADYAELQSRQTVKMHFNYVINMPLSALGWTSVRSSQRWMQCICEATSNCDFNIGCSENTCEPYAMTCGYWNDGQRPGCTRTILMRMALIRGAPMTSSVLRQPRRTTCRGTDMTEMEMEKSPATIMQPHIILGATAVVCR
jgi:hypothetical protein